MPDILKVTTPVVQNQSVASKAGVSQIQPLSVHDPSRAMQTQANRETQRPGMPLGGEAPTMLLNLLKDPAVAVTYLKNIFLLEEIFKLLPVNNKTVTPEIEQIFQQLLLQKSDIPAELKRQEHASTMFKGPLFDFLREFSLQHRSNPEVQMAVAMVLKALNNVVSREEILQAVTNSLQYMRKNLGSSPELSQRLDALIQAFHQNDAGDQIEQLKDQTLTLLKDIEQSLLFSSKLSKVISMLVYNLSRYQDNPSFLHESSYRLRQYLRPDERRAFVQYLEEVLEEIRQGNFPKLGLDANQTNAQSSVMDALIKLVSKQAGQEELTPADAAKVDKILHSLLSSPCNFTPLLHFIIPVVHENMRAFAEIWINPESDEKDLPPGVTEGKHFLMVIDVDGIGRFETELIMYGKTLDVALYCPTGYESGFEDMMRNLPKTLKDFPYRIGNTKLATLEKSRSLMDVFKSLPYKRVGVDVKI